MKRMFLCFFLVIFTFGLAACDGDVNENSEDSITAIVSSETYKSYQNGEVSSTVVRNFNEDGDVISVDNNMNSENITSNSMYIYEENVVTIDSIRTDSTGIYYDKYVCTNDDAGNELSSLYYEEDKLKLTTLSEYENGNCVAYTAYDVDGNENMKTLTKYDDLNRKILYEYYDAGVMYYAEQYVYGEGENLTTNYLDGEGEIIKYEVKEIVDLPNGYKEITITIYDEDGDAYSREISIYDENEKILEIINEDVLYRNFSKTECLYGGDLLETVTFASGNSIDDFGEVSILSQCTYDEKGRILTDGDDYSQIVYSYDGENLMSKTAIDEAGFGWTIDYTYFD